MKFTNDRITLRYFSKRDFHYYHALETQNFYQAYESSSIPSEELLRKRFSHILDNEKEEGYHKFLIIDHQRQVVVGDIMIWRTSKDLKQWEIGWGLFESETKKGYVTEAAKLLTCYLFEELKIHKLLAFTHVHNTPSRQVMQRLNMTHEGTLRHDRMLNGQYYDNLCYGLLDFEYFNQKEWEASVSGLKLLPIDISNFEECIDMEVYDNQKSFVAPNWYSLIQAKFMDEMYPLAIYHQDTMIGFVMVCYDPGDERWEMCRLMIDQKYQAKGYGKEVMRLLLLRMKDFIGSSDFYLSVEAENKSASLFYEKLGFRKTGQVAYDEDVMTISLHHDQLETPQENSF